MCTYSSQVAESNQLFVEQLDGLEEDLHRQIKQSSLSLSAHLRQDDDCLERLAAASVHTSDYSDQGTTERVGQLTSKLSEFSELVIKHRLNRIYLQLLQHNVNQNIQQHEHLDESELERDLQSLYVEIPDVAAMWAAQEFQDPFLRSVARQHSTATYRERMVLEDVCEDNLGRYLRGTSDTQTDDIGRSADV
jgi:hypothetical protein